MSTRAETRRSDLAVAKERRQKMIAFGGLGVLAAVLVIQGPRMLDLFRGPSSPTAASTPATPAPAPADRSDAPGRALLFKGSTNDPFAPSSLVDNDPRAGAVAAPAGTHDPFVPSGGSAGASASTAPSPEPVAQPLPKRIVIGTPTPNAVAKRGWIVVLASIQTRVGRRYAETFATRVRLNGLTPVAVLNSSTRKPLRSGYYVVYTGPFATLGDVQRSAAHVHAFGYRTAYIREILRY